MVTSRMVLRERDVHDEKGIGNRAERFAPTGCRLTQKEADRLRRRIARMRKAGMLDIERLGTTVRRAVTVDDLEAAYALVHSAYVEKGYMNEQNGGVRVRVFEAVPEMATFIACVDGRVAAVTSVCVDSTDLGLPSDHVFGRDLDRMRQESGQVFEITNLAIAPEYRNTPVFLQLTQACFAHALAHGCGNMFIAISPGHARFFHDVFQFEPVGPPRSYSDEVDDEVQGMRVFVPGFGDFVREFDNMMGPDDAFLYDFYFARNPYHREVRPWHAAAQLIFSDPMMLRDLFLLRSGFLQGCNDAEEDAVRRRWGDYVYMHVWADDNVELMRPSLVA